jgi:hypothetical protein
MLGFFGFGRRKEVQARARSLGDLLLLLVESINSMSLDDFVKANHRRGFVDSYLDFRKREYGFFEDEAAKSDFSFHVRYDDFSPMLTVEGHHRYYGIIISGSQPGRIGIDVSSIIPPHELGKDAFSLRDELSKFPGFTSVEQLRKMISS